MLLILSGKLLLNFFCQIVADVTEISATKALITPILVKSVPTSKPKTKNAPENPSITPIHCLEVIFSFNKGDAKIFVKIVKILRQPSSLVGITPDGPKGPERIPKPGIIKAAQKTEALIIPVSAVSTKNWQFTNWHTFFLEKPFGKIFLQYGEPLQLDPEHDFETCKRLLSDAMDKVESTNKEYAKNNT
mgnify:CR=1 FL=1